MPTKNTKEVAEPAQAKPPARPEFQRLAEILEEEHNLFEPGPSGRIPAPEPGSDAADHDRKLEAIIAAIHASKNGRSALCLSGGGIRSACFGLGVLSPSRAKECSGSSTIFPPSQAVVTLAGG